MEYIQSETSTFSFLNKRDYKNHHFEICGKDVWFQYFLLDPQPGQYEIDGNKDRHCHVPTIMVMIERSDTQFDIYRYDGTITVEYSLNGHIAENTIVNETEVRDRLQAFIASLDTASARQ